MAEARRALPQSDAQVDEALAGMPAESLHQGFEVSPPIRWGEVSR